ncbi:DUF1326 domain-containing protein [Nitrospira sp. Kam-Ns4a]
MATATKTDWRLVGEEFGGCNCVWACPCQFNALPTTGRCEALATYRVSEGYFGDTRLDGARFASLYWWPGPVHEGNGHSLLILDERLSPAQRQAVIALTSGQYGGAYFEIFAAVCPNRREPAVARIEIEADRERRRGRVHIPGFVECQAEPIRNPVTGEEHRVRIDLPNGFEYKQAEIGNMISMRATAGGKLSFQNQNTYAQFNAFDWKP